MKATILISLVPALLGAGSDPQHAGTDTAEELNRELTAYLRAWNEQEEALGERRRRRLRIARYHLSREDGVFDLAEDDPLAFEETRDILESCFVKLVRERLERHLPIEELGDRLRRTAGPPERGGLEISPRLGLGGDPYLGVNLKLRGGEDALRSRFTLGLRERLEGGGDSVFLQYENGDRFLRLEYVFTAEEEGDRIVASVRTSF